MKISFITPKPLSSIQIKIFLQYFIFFPSQSQKTTYPTYINIHYFCVLFQFKAQSAGFKSNLH